MGVILLMEPLTSLRHCSCLATKLVSVCGLPYLEVQTLSNAKKSGNVEQYLTCRWIYSWPICDLLWCTLTLRNLASKPAPTGMGRETATPADQYKGVSMPTVHPPTFHFWRRLSMCTGMGLSASPAFRQLNLVVSSFAMVPSGQLYATLCKSNLIILYI